MALGLSSLSTRKLQVSPSASNTSSVCNVIQPGANRPLFATPKLQALNVQYVDGGVGQGLSFARLEQSMRERMFYHGRIWGKACFLARDTHMRVLKTQHWDSSCLICLCWQLISAVFYEGAHRLCLWLSGIRDQPVSAWAEGLSCARDQFTMFGGVAEAWASVDNQRIVHMEKKTMSGSFVSCFQLIFRFQS
jgi:hypothetical protein